MVTGDTENTQMALASRALPPGNHPAVSFSGITRLRHFQLALPGFLIQSFVILTLQRGSLFHLGQRSALFIDLLKCTNDSLGQLCLKKIEFRKDTHQR